MSAFMVSQKQFNAIGSMFFSTVYPQHLKHKGGNTVAAYLGCSTGANSEDLTKAIHEKLSALYLLNGSAINQRYGDPLEAAPTWNQYGLETFNPLQLIQFLSCLFYQCCEFDPETEPEELRKLGLVIRELSYNYVRNLPEWEKLEYSI